MAKLPPMEDKDFADRKPYFDEGVHEVYIKKATRGSSPKTGSEYIEFDLLGENDEEGNVRLYLTEKTQERSRSILATIAVHNKQSDVEKQAVRDAFKKITDTDQLDDDFLKKFVDLQAWILTEQDTNAPKPNGGFYLRNNLYSYEPTPRTTATSPATTASQLLGGTDADLDEVPFK